MTVDCQGNEGRDVQALIDYVAKQPEAQLDGPGDPRVGMHGASYAGGIELVAARDRQAHRRDRPRHRLALAADLPLQGGHRQGRLVARRCTRAGRAGNLDPHISSAFASGADHRQAVGRGPRVVRLARAEHARGAHPRAHVPDPGHGRHAVHARRGDHQLRDPARQRRAREDDVVLRRARHVPDRHRRGWAHRARGDRVDEALPGGRQARRHRPALRVAGRRREVALGLPTTRCPRASRSWPRAPARWPSARPTPRRATRSPPGRRSTRSTCRAAAPRRRRRSSASRRCR